MTKIKQQKRGLAPLDLRVQDHYEEMLTVDEAAKLSGFSKQFIYRLTKTNSLRYCILGGITRIKYRHLRAWFAKLPSNRDCHLCPASFSLAGLMGYTKMGRCWVCVLSKDTTFAPIIWVILVALIMKIASLRGLLNKP